MRKVHAKVEVTVMVPVHATLDLLIKADEGAGIASAVKRHLKGKPSPGADVEDIQVGDVTPADLREFVFEALQGARSEITVGEITVADSR